MKKLLIMVLLLISLVGLVFSGLKLKDYLDNKNKTEEEKIASIDKQIKETEDEIKKTQGKIDNIKEENKEEVELMEQWQKQVEEIKVNLQ